MSSKASRSDLDFSVENKSEKKKKSFLSSFMASVFFFILITGAVVAVALIFFLKDITTALPTSQEILEHEPSLATTIYDRNGKVVTQLFQENRTWVKLSDISPWMVKAILAAEDDTFYEHSGIRPAAIVRAVMVDFFHRGAKQGASTITQQLARNLFLTKEKTMIRKAKEAVLALRLEKIYTKDQLLEMYLNTIYMGHGAYGIEAAAKSYFGKSPKQLTIDESAILAGLVAAPEKYSPFKNEQSSQTRKAYVMGRMLDLDWISKDDYDHFLNKEPRLNHKTRRRSSLVMEEAPYFVSYILFKQLLPNYGTEKIYRGGLRVNTTIDIDLQKKAEQLVSKMGHEGALVALDPNTGEILALVGGRDFSRSKFNRATQAYRQPGSAFKPFVYTTALEQGYRGVDHVLDAPLYFSNGWAPGNYSAKKFDGEMTLMAALAKSINTVAVRLAQIVGVSSITDVARRMGITTPYMPDDLSLALGTASVTPLELGAAYCAFANNGYKVDPYAIKEIQSRGGESLEQNGPNLSNAISSTTAVTMRSMLEQVTGWGTGAKAKMAQYETFGKTGTTNDWTDAWFVGGIPGLVVVVYVGNDNHKPLGGRSTGTIAALPVWREFVNYAVTKLNLPPTFSIPEDAEVEAVSVCKKSGFLATAGCPATTLLLPAGHAPTTGCPLHGASAVAAREDANAPQFLVAPIDDDMTVNRYASRTETGTEGDGTQSADSGETAAPQTPQESIPLQQKKPAKKEAVKLPSAAETAPYKTDHSQQSEMDKKYEELLKKYKIIE